MRARRCKHWPLSKTAAKVGCGATLLLLALNFLPPLQQGSRHFVYREDDYFMSSALRDHLFINNQSVPRLYPNMSFFLEGEPVDWRVMQFLLARLASKPHLANHSRSCVVVGSGGCLRHTHLGPRIDTYDVIIRVNAGPIAGHEHLVGSRTDLRVAYPESAPADPLSYRAGEGRRALLLVPPYKPDDLLWVARQLDRSAFHDREPVFWREVPDRVPIPAGNILLVNPRMLYYPRLLGEKRMTAGTLAIRLAARVCSLVHVAGFCYDSRLLYAYYYGNQSMQANLDERSTHDKLGEMQLRRHFREMGWIDEDLTEAVRL